MNFTVVGLINWSDCARGMDRPCIARSDLVLVPGLGLSRSCCTFRTASELVPRLSSGQVTISLV